jgi:hypothetical protein
MFTITDRIVVKMRLECAKVLAGSERKTLTLMMIPPLLALRLAWNDQTFYPQAEAINM